jgi:FkbM family methyltransferase
MYIINGIKEILANTLNENYKKTKSFPLVTLTGDHIGTRILLNGYYECEQLVSLVDLLRLNNRLSDQFLDIGANIGNHSIYLAPFFKQIIAVEADPKIYKILQANIDLNSLTHVHAVNFAASDCEGSITFEPAIIGNLGTGKVISDKNSSSLLNSVRAIKVDNLLPEYGNIKINFIKLDIEGHEHNALSGLAEAIGKYEPIIAFESNDLESFMSVKKLMNGLGYYKFYSLQFPFASYPKLARVPLRVLLNAKRRWVEILKADSSCVNDLIICSKIDLLIP